MTYTSVMTSKGTITVPAELRKKFGLKPGDAVAFSAESRQHGITIKPTMSWEELQKKNQAVLKRHNIKPLSDEQLKSTAETAHIKEAAQRYRGPQ
jgi:AbrB family looped-hinge helix DNA binding protein